MSEPTLYQELEPTVVEGIVDSFGVETGDLAACVEMILDTQVSVERATMKSEPTLYQVKGVAAARPDELQYLIDDGWLVPVERCVHGNIDRHVVDNPDPSGHAPEWGLVYCPGVGIGDDDE